MDMLFGHTHSIPKVVKTKLIPVEVIDERPLRAIIEETIPLALIMGSHRETMTFNLICSPQNRVILWLSWLGMHNPIVDWRRQSLDFTTWMGKANNKFKVVPNIGTSPGQVKPEDDHLAQAATTVEHSTSILSKYKEFSNVFEKQNGDQLPEHRLCPIDIQDGAYPPFGPIYELSKPKLDAFRAYIDEHLEKGFIPHSKSLAKASILLVKKKDGSLRLCVDY